MPRQGQGGSFAAANEYQQFVPVIHFCCVWRSRQTFADNF